MNALMLMTDIQPTILMAQNVIRDILTDHQLSLSLLKNY